MSDSNDWNRQSDEELLALNDADFAAATADVAALLHDGRVDIEPEQPTTSLWDAIAAEAGIGALETELVQNVSADSSERHRSDVEDRSLGTVQPLERRRAGVGSAFTAKSRWSGRTAALTLVAACMLLVLVPIGLSLRSSNEPANVIAAADLEVLDDSAVSGHADLVAEDGGAAIELDVEATAPTDEYLELWLLAVDATTGDIETLSLGRINGDGPYEVPTDIDRTRFTIVDISIEADDGDETHSGRSILRGQLVG